MRRNLIRIRLDLPRRASYASRASTQLNLRRRQVRAAKSRETGTSDHLARFYIGLPSITVVPVGDFVATALVSSNPAAR